MKTLTLKLKNLISLVVIIVFAIALVVVGFTKKEELSNLAKQKYLEGNNQTRITWGDLTGSGYDATAYNATWNDASTGMVFNGATSYAAIKEANLEQFTLEVAFRASNLDKEGEQTLIANFQNGGYGLIIRDKKLIGKAYLDGEWKEIFVEEEEEADADILEEGLMYVAHLSFDGQKLTLYQDGEEIGSVTGETLTYPQNNTIMMLGSDPNGTSAEGNYYEGNIYEAKIYTKSLNEEEIENNLEIVERVYADGVSGRLNNIEGYIQDGLIMDLEGRKIERTQERVADLSLRTFITKINGEELSTSREPNVEIEDGNFVYKHAKNRINVVKGDVLTYKIRVYNEGKEAANAEKVGIYLPEEMNLVGLDDDQSINKTYLWNQDEGNVFITKYLSNQEIKRNGVKIIENRSIPAYSESTGLQYRDIELEVQVKEDITIDDGYRLVVVAEIMKESQNDTDSTPRNFNMLPADIREYKREDAESSNVDSYIAGKEDDDDFDNVYVNKTYDTKIELNKISIANDKNIGGGKVRILNNIMDSDIKLKVYNKATLEELTKDQDGYVVPPQEGIVIGLSRLQKNIDNEILVEEESAPEGYSKVIDSTTLKVKINANEDVEAQITSVIEKRVKADGTSEVEELFGSISKDAVLKDEDENGKVTKDGTTTGQRVEYKIGEDGEWTRYTGTFKLQTNKTIYARSTDGTNYSGTTIKVVDNIDKIAPVIDTIADKEETLDIETSIEVHTTDSGNEDYGASGISKYGISENDVDEPEEWLDADKTTDFTGTIEHIEDEGTFRVWVKDVAGNIAISNEFRIDLPDIPVARITSITDSNGDEISSLVATEYYTLEECLAAIPEGANANVQVIHRIYNESNVVDGNKTITLDLNGYTVGNRSRREPTFEIGSENGSGSLTVINNKGRGGVSSNNTEAIVINNNGSFTLGEDNKRVVQSQPKVTGKTTGVDVKNGGVFNFYDGNITAEKAIYGNVNSTPVGYNAFIEDSTTDELQTATLQVISNVEARIGRKMYTLLEDAIADCQTKYGTDGSQVEVVLLKNIAKDQTIEIAQNQNIKLDLNGHDFTTTTNGYVVDNKGQFELYDSSVMTGSYDYKVEAEDTSRVSRNGGSNISTSGFTGVQRYNELSFNFDIEEYGTYMLSTSGIYMSREADIYLDDSETSMYNFAERTYGAEYTTVNVILDNLDAGTHRIRIVNNAEGGEQPIIDYFEVSNNKGSGRIYSTTNHVIHNCNFDERVTDISKIDTVDYEELIASEEVSLHESYYSQRTFQPGNSIHRNENNEIVADSPVCEDWASGYVEIDLTDRETKPFLLEIDYKARSAANRRLDLYFTTHEYGYVDHNNRILYRDGGNFDLDNSYKVYVQGGKKYYLHISNYKNRYCSTDMDFRVKSIKLVEVDNYNMATLTITSGIIDTQKEGSDAVRTGGVFNEGKLIVNGGHFTSSLKNDASYKSGIYNYGLATINDAEFDGMIVGIQNGWYNHDKWGVMPAIIKINNINMHVYYTNIVTAGHSTVEIAKGTFNAVRDYELHTYWEDSTFILRPEKDEDIQLMAGGNYEIYMPGDYGNQVYIYGGTFRHEGCILYNNNVHKQVEIHGGDFYSSSGEMMYFNEGAHHIINGGKFVTNGDRIFRCPNYMRLTINDGEFRAIRGNSNILYNDWDSYDYGRLIINGGYFTNTTETNDYNSWTLFQFQDGNNFYMNGGELLAGNTVFYDNRNAGDNRLYIKGGKITSNHGPLISGDNNNYSGILEIGTKDGDVKYEPIIKVASNQPLIYTNKFDIYFYDGILYANKDNFSNSKFTEIEDETEVISEVQEDGSLKVWLDYNSDKELVEIYECTDNPSLVGTKYSSIQKAFDVCSTNAGDNVTKVRLLCDYTNFNNNTILKGQNIIFDQDSYNLYNLRDNAFTNYGKFELINTKRDLYHEETENIDLINNHVYPNTGYNFRTYHVAEDKSGSNLDMEIIGTEKDTESDGIKFGNSSYGMFRNYNITNAEQKSLEIVLKTTTAENNCIYISPSGRHMAFGVWDGYFLLSCGGDNKKYPVPADYYDGTMKDIVINYDHDTNVYTIYYNGVKMENPDRWGNWYGIANDFAAFLGKRGNQDFFHGTIFALRQYSENLTEEQIATNLSVNTAKYVNNQSVDNYTKDNIILDIDCKTIDWTNVSLVNDNINYSDTNAWGYQKIDLTGKSGRYTITVNAECSISNYQGYTSWGHVRVNTDTSVRGQENTDGRFIHITGEEGAKDYTYEVEGGQVYYVHYGMLHAWHDYAIETFKINSIKVSTVTKGKVYSKNANLIKNGDKVVEGEWDDLSQYNRNGILVGPTWNENNNGLYFDGDDYVRVAQLNYPKMTFETTFEIHSIHSGWNTIFSNYQYGGFGLSVYGGENKLYARAYINGAYREIRLDEEIELDTKYTAGIIEDGNRLYLYVNGRVITSWYSGDNDTYRYFPDNSTYFCLGGDAYSNYVSGEWFNGTIYSVRGYNRALTGLEIAQNYQKDRELYYGSSTEYIENITGYVDDGKILDLEGRHHENKIDNTMYAKLGENVYVDYNGYKSVNIIENSGTFDIDTYKMIVNGTNVRTIRNYNDATTNVYNIDYDCSAYSDTAIFDNYQRSVVNYYGGDTEITTSESSIVFNNYDNSVVNIYDGTIRKNGRYAMIQNMGDSTMNIYDGTITCEGRWDGETHILYNCDNAKLYIYDGVIKYIGNSNWSQRNGIRTVNNAEFHITGGKMVWDSYYGNNSYIIRNSSTKECSIENYDIHGTELSPSTEIIYLLNEGSSSKVTINNSKFWQDSHSGNWYNPSAIHNYGIVKAENFTADNIYWGVEQFGGTVDLKDCYFDNTTVGFRIDGGTINSDNVEITNCVNGVNKSGSSVLNFKDSTIDSTGYGISCTGGETNIYGESTITAATYGINNTGGTLTLGIEGANSEEQGATIVDTEKPYINAVDYGINNTARFNFYDGRIKAKDECSLTGNITAKETGYQIKVTKYDDGKEDSILAKLPIVEIVGVGQYTNLNDFQEAIDDLETEEEIDGETVTKEYRINLLQNVSIDAEDEGLEFKSGLKATFDIKGYRFVSANTDVITNYGDITFIDSVGTGEYYNNSNGSFFINNGKMKLQSVRVNVLGSGPSSSVWKKIFDNKGNLEFNTVNFTSSGGSYTHMIYDDGAASFKDTNSTITGSSSLGETARERIYNNATGDMEFTGTNITYIAYIQNLTTGNMKFNNVYHDGGYEIINYSSGDMTFNGTTKSYTTYGICNEGSNATGTITINGETLISGYYNAFMNESTGTFIMNGGTIETRYNWSPETIRQTGNGLIQINGGTVSNHVKRIFAGKMVVDGETAAINGEYIYLNSTNGMSGTFELLKGDVNCRIQMETDDTTTNILGGNVNCSASSWAIDCTSHYTNLNIGTKDGVVSTTTPHITGYIWSYYYSNTNFYDGVITVANTSDYLDPEMGFYGLINELEEGYTLEKNVNSENSDWYDVKLVEQKEIAEVDETKYDDFQEAIDACTTSGKTIKILKDFVTLKTYTIPSGVEEGSENQELKKVTIDLNGHFVSPMGRKTEDTEHVELSRTWIVNNADLTFIDSVQATEDEEGNRPTKNKTGKIHGFVQNYIKNYGELKFDAIRIFYKSQAYTSLILNYDESNVSFDDIYVYDRTCSGYTNHYIVDNYSTGEIKLENSIIDFYGLYTSYRNSEQYFVYNRSNNSEKHTKFTINNTIFTPYGSSAYYFVMDDYNGYMDTEIHDSQLVSFNQIKNELKIYDSSINGYMYSNDYAPEITFDNVTHNRYIDCDYAWFTIKDSNLGTSNNWGDSYFRGRVRSIKNTLFSTYSWAEIYGTDGAGVIEDTRLYRVHTYNASNLEFNNVTILEYLENGTNSRQNCRVTINSGTYDQIYNNVVNDVITINGGTFRYIENRANATMYLYGGTVNNTSGIGVNNIGIFTLGNDDGEVSIEEPSITGTTYGLQNTGTFNFYDGIIQGQNKAINGSVTAKPQSYRVSYLQNNTVAILDYVTQVENAVTMNGVYYNSLDAAIKVAPDNVETTLYINNEIGLTDTLVIPAEKNLVINLQGNSITYSSTEAAIINNGALRIYDYYENDEGIHETTYGAVRNDRGLAIDNRSTLVLGENDGSIDTTTPSVVGLGESVRNTGTFGFYDGRTIILDNNGNETITVADGSVQTASREGLSSLRRLADNEQGNNNRYVISNLSNPEIAVTPDYWTNQDVDVTMNATDRVILNVGDREHGMDLALKQYISKVGDKTYNRKPVVTEETEQAILSTQNGVYGRSDEEVYANVEEGEDKVTYTISVYNEGTETGYAAEIIEFIPEGLTFDATNETNIANGWTVAATDSSTGRVTAVKTNNLANQAVLASVDSDSIVKLLTGEIETVPSVDLVLNVTATPTKEKVYITTNGEITSAKDSSGNEYGTYYTEGNGVNSDLDSTPANYPGVSEDDNDGDTFYVLMQKGRVNIKYVDQKTNEEIADETSVEGFVGDEFNALSYGKTIEGYKLVREPENPAGTFTAETQEKVFYYAKKSAGVIVNHIDVNTNVVIKTETKTGVEDQEYTTSSEEFAGYDLVEDRLPNNSSGIMTIEAITVNYYYERQTTVRVQYLDKYLSGDEAKLRDDIIINGHQTDSYTTEAKTFEGYKLDEDNLPQNANGNMGVVVNPDQSVNTETLVRYYYIKESEGVEVIHKDVNSNKVLASETKEGYEGDSYTTSAKTISLYDLVEDRMPENASGTFTKAKQTVTYYYEHVASIKVQYIDKNTNQAIVDDDMIDGHENDVREVRPRDFDGYALMPESIKDDYNVTMVITRDENNDITSFETVVTFYYKLISSGVIEKHIDIYTDTLLEEAIVHEGNVGDSYDIQPKTFTGFDLVESIGEGDEAISMLPSNAQGTMTQEAIEVKYYYARKTKLIVKYVDIQTNEEIPNTRDEVNNHRGDSYQTTGKEIVGYKLQEDRLPDNASGTMDITENEGVINTVTTVTYYYESTSSSGVTVHFRDIKTDRDIKVNGESTSYVITGERYDEYTTEPISIEGYNLVETVQEEIIVDGETITHDVSKLPENASGRLLEDAQDVIYYYVKQATVRVEYYDTATDEKVVVNNETVEDTVLNGEEGEGYTTSPKAIEGFIFDEDKLPSNSTGVYTVVRDDNYEPTNTEVVVKYYYKAVSEGVVVNHIDVKHDTILDTELLEGIEGNTYETSAKTFEGYDLVETRLPDNSSGRFTKGAIVVNYYYIRNTQVVVNYVDIEGGNLADTITIDNHEGDQYTTEAETFENYRLLATPENSTGTTEVKVVVDDTTGETSIDVVTYVTYEYESTISAGLIVHHKDIKTNEDIITETITGDRYAVAYISAKDIENYDLVEYEIVDGEERSLLPESEEITLVKELQEVTYYYIRKTSVIVEYRNTLTNEEILDASRENGHEGDGYSVRSADIDGYVLDNNRLPDNISGTMNVTRTDEGVIVDTIVTFYYHKISSGVIEKHINIYDDSVLYEEVHEGNVGDPYDISSKEFDNYDLVESIGTGDDEISMLPENSTGTMRDEAIEVKYYYARRAKVVVKHIDIQTNEEVSPRVTINGHVGDRYETTYDIPDGYRLVEIPDNNQGRMIVTSAEVDGQVVENDTIEVIYKYESKYSSGIVVHYRDIKTDQDIMTEAKAGERYEEYTTEPIDIENYELVETIKQTFIIDGEEQELDVSMLPENATGIFLEERQDVVYYYIRKAHIKIEHIDVMTNEEIISADIVEGVEGDNYKAEPRNIDEYVLYQEDLEGHSYMPTNAEGTMTIARDEDGKVVNDEIVVKYYYVSASEGVAVKYIDIIKDTLLDSYLIEGHVGDDYETIEKEFVGYDIVKVDKDGNDWYPTNTKGKLTIGLIEVDYFYVRRATVTVMYLNNKNERIAKDEIIEGHEGDNYSTVSKDIEGYELVKDKNGNEILPENYQGKMKTTMVDGEVDIDTLVIYRYVEEGGQKPEPEPEPVNNTIENKVNNSVDNNIVEPDTVKVDASVRVQYIDKSSNKKLTTDTVIEGYVGDKYNVKAKEFDGYELIDVPDNASGTMKINIVDGKETTETLVKLYYAKKATGRLPQTGEEIARAVLLTVAVMANISLAIIAFKKLRSEDKE